MFALGFTLAGVVAARRSVPAPAPGAAATAFPTAPSVHFHFASQTVSVDGGGRLTACPDLRGLATLGTIAAKTAPRLMTDALGRQFLRFNGADAASIANGLVLGNRAFTVVMVGRCPHSAALNTMVMPRYAAFTSPSVNTAANASIGYLRAYSNANSAAALHANHLPSTFSNTADCHKVIPGAQLQVMAIASRTTANGGTRLYLNNDTCDVAQQTTGVTGYLGAILGGAASANNSETASTGNDRSNVFDCYALAIWAGELANAQSDACVAAAVANYAIPQLDSNLVLAGDSITDGIATATGPSPAWSGNLAVRLTEPGGELVAGNVRVLNAGVSGSQTSGLVASRDAPDGVFIRGLYPGGPAKNRVAVQIGRNDVAQTAGQKNSATLYADIVALINTASTGYLQRGWSVTQVANMAGPGTAVSSNVSPAGENTIHKRLEGLRALIADAANHVPQPQFLLDTLSGSGQAYEGLVDVLHLYDLSTGGVQPFKPVTGLGVQHPVGPYDSDGTHPTAQGHTLMATGGETPQHGYGALA